VTYVVTCRKQVSLVLVHVTNSVAGKCAKIAFLLAHNTDPKVILYFVPSLGGTLNPAIVISLIFNWYIAMESIDQYARCDVLLSCVFLNLNYR
jgi:uncharacterized protein involved in cysteine biosynthesis